ncbi:uncharacterized protein LOC116347655 [Contarinia nasturtii]|uniref:uncharacterized protein LOC116347655 n=1 Tax=Contarinia nasturtii TaxID=265458 RepID=UPI0012D420A8|nr:uncharacterized protein LOC116347655 [Contarinia nasturtii]
MSDVHQNNLAVVDFFKLNIDCLEELFEWLSLSDLRSLRQTCQRMKKAVTFYIHLNYPLRFGQFEYIDDALDDLEKFDENFSKLYKHFRFDYHPLTNDVIDKIKHLLLNIEKVTICNVQIDGRFYETFFDVCKNLKSLTLNEFSQMDLDHEWMHRQCSTLEEFRYFDSDFVADYDSNAELKTFLELNPIIKKLSISSDILNEWMIESNLHLESLHIQHLPPLDEMNQLCNLLNALHDKGIYKSLQFFAYFSCDEMIMNELTALRGLETLYIENLSTGMVFKPLNEVKFFYMDSDKDVTNMNIDVLTKCFPNIEQINFQFANFDNVLPFIQRSAKLKELKVYSPDAGTYFNDGIIDLRSLNKECEKCVGGSKLTVFVKETVFLATKISKMRTKYSLIELKRADRFWKTFD